MHAPRPLRALLALTALVTGAACGAGGIVHPRGAQRSDDLPAPPATAEPQPVAATEPAAIDPGVWSAPTEPIALAGSPEQDYKERYGRCDFRTSTEKSPLDERHVLRIRIPKGIPPRMTVEPNVDKRGIRATITHNMTAVRECYDRALLVWPKLAGKIAVEFVIGPKGSVIDARVAKDGIGNRPLACCVARQVYYARFAPPGVELVFVTYPFVLYER